ncbi:hypothetical protein ABMA28_003729 [Loxostege sticticalis]|uniref:ascorbate ferrireductase (transmembrane) n=1 Tax=Loxostege sticticalis TaxID=481309 RepID=A0ABD0SVC0_LOXSC
MLCLEDSTADRACNLECVKDLAPIHEFVGNVKIVLMDVPKDVYCKKACLSAFIGLAHILMGATVFTVLFYTAYFETPLIVNLHILLCTIGYQLFIPSAILMVNSLNGPSATLKHSDRKFQHLFLQLFGIGCAASGSILVMFFAGDYITDRFTIHSIAGLVAAGLTVAAALTGPGAYFSRDSGTLGKVGKRTHSVFGAPAFCASSICFILGLYFSEVFNAWMTADMLYIIIVFCVVYTLIILSTPLMKLFGKTP